MVLYKIINLGGGVRYSRVSEDVSHVVLGEKEQSIVTEIQQLNNRFVGYTYTYCIEDYFRKEFKIGLLYPLAKNN